MLADDAVEMRGNDLVHVADRWVEDDSERCLVVFEQVVGEDGDLATLDRIDHLHLVVGEVCDLEAILLVVVGLRWLLMMC